MLVHYCTVGWPAVHVLHGHVLDLHSYLAADLSCFVALLLPGPNSCTESQIFYPCLACDQQGTVLIFSRPQNPPHIKNSPLPHVRVVQVVRTASLLCAMPHRCAGNARGEPGHGARDPPPVGLRRHHLGGREVCIALHDSPADQVAASKEARVRVG